MIETDAICLTGARKLERRKRVLEAGPNDVIVETTSASICDADLRAWRGLHMPGDLPSFEWIGHEGGGHVIEVGANVTDFAIGDHVMCFGPNNSWARHFKAHSDTVLKSPSNLTAVTADLGEPTAVGLYAAMRANVQLGDRVAVIGLNYQGLLAVQALKRGGASELVAMDYSDRHLEIAKARGADKAINIEASGLASAMELGHFDIVFHSCGYWNPRAEEYFNLAIRLTRDEGHFVSVPDMMRSATVDLHRFHHHAIQVTFPALMHHNPNYLKIWTPRVLRPLATGQIDLDGLITGNCTLDTVEDAMHAFDTDLDHVKITIQPQ